MVYPLLDDDCNARYLEVHNLMSEQVKRGEIRAFSCSFDHERGRVIHCETDDGWNPNPVYADYGQEMSEFTVDPYL